MRPNNTYSFAEKLTLSPDYASLSQCYQPIIGLEAFALYHYLCVTNDKGSGRYRFSYILNHLNFGMQVLEHSLDILSAMKLLSVYQKEEHITLVLRAPLSSQEFLQNALYRSLLAKKIGESAVEQMQIVLPASEYNVSKSFSDVFESDGQTAPLNPVKERFDLEAFKRTMSRNNLRFQDETTDVIGLYHLAEQENWTWLDAYQVAKATAVNQQISVKRMQEQVRSRQTARTNTGEFSSAEETIIRESKSLAPIDFLTAIKESKKAAVIASERQCLLELASLGLLDEVINVIVLYTFNKVDSANLNEKYALKLGNDFSYKEIRSAEVAVTALREGRKSSSVAHKSTKTEASSNVPTWSNPEYKNETSLEKQAELEEQKRKLLAKLDQGGA